MLTTFKLRLIFLPPVPVIILHVVIYLFLTQVILTTFIVLHLAEVQDPWPTRWAINTVSFLNGVLTMGMLTGIVLSISALVYNYRQWKSRHFVLKARQVKQTA